MFYKLNQNTTLNVLESLLKPDLEAQLKDIKVSQMNSATREYLLLDILDWAYYLERSKYTPQIIPYVNDFLNLYYEYKEILLILSLPAYLEEENLEKVLNVLKDDNKVSKLYKLYSIFCTNCIELQKRFFSEYKINNSSIPVMVIPFSQSLNKIYRDMIIVRNTENEDILELTCYSYLDNIRRIKMDTQDSFFIFYEDDSKYGSSTKIPTTWTESLVTLKPSQSTYNDRMTTIRELYRQYMFFGWHNIPHVDMKAYLVNFPYMLISNREIILEEKWSSKIRKIDLIKFNI